jgi:hypothetical protein
MAKSTQKTLKARAFVRRQIIADDKISDDQILQNWKALYAAAPLTIKTIRRERTIFAKAMESAASNDCRPFRFFGRGSGVDGRKWGFQRG